MKKNIPIKLGILLTVFSILFRLPQLFLKLISNSVQFIRPDVAPTISISDEKTTSENLNFTSQKLYKIIVKDNRIDFNAACEKKVFKIFQRLHSQTEFLRTGIGLSIYKKIVELHDDCIEAEGREGEAAIFSFYLPMEHLPK